MAFLSPFSYSCLSPTIRCGIGQRTIRNDIGLICQVMYSRCFNDNIYHHHLC